jgi:hypothetical protein
MRRALCLLVPLMCSSSLRAQDARRVAIFPLILKGDVDSGVVEGIQELLYAGIEGADVTTVHTSELRGLLRRRPHSAIARCERCKSFATCVAKLAVKRT